MLAVHLKFFVYYKEMQTPSNSAAVYRITFHRILISAFLETKGAGMRMSNTSTATSCIFT